MDQPESLTYEDWDEVVGALSHALRAVSDYADYPSYEFKCRRRAEVRRALEKARAHRRATKP